MYNFNVDNFHTQRQSDGTYKLILFQSSNVVGECEFSNENLAKRAGMMSRDRGVDAAYELSDID